MPDGALAQRDDHFQLQVDPAKVTEELSQLASQGDDVAAYECSVLQHQLGNHAQGDQLAGGLGFHWRLANDVFTGAGERGRDVLRKRRKRKRKTGSAPVFSVIDGILPPSLLRGLRHFLRRGGG